MRSWCPRRFSECSETVFGVYSESVSKVYSKSSEIVLGVYSESSEPVPKVYSTSWSQFPKSTQSPRNQFPKSTQSLWSQSESTQSCSQSFLAELLRQVEPDFDLVLDAEIHLGFGGWPGRSIPVILYREKHGNSNHNSWDHIFILWYLLPAVICIAYQVV